MAAPPPSADSRCFGDRKGEEDWEEGYWWRTNISLINWSHCRPLSTQSWLVSKARRVGHTPKADSLVWFMSVLMGISEEPPHSIVHWYGISIIPTPSILFSKRLVHSIAPCYWRALILWAALLFEISAKELQVSHRLDGMFNPLETHSPFPVGAGAGHSTIAALSLHPCASLQSLSLSWVFRGRSASLMPRVWGARLFLPCGRHIQALQMIIWGVPLFKVRQGKGIPVLPLGQWQCHLSISTVLPEASNSKNSRLLM